MSTFAERIIEINNELDFGGALPNGIKIMNPFIENPQIPKITKAFYTKYYSDSKYRHLVLGINPGRFGAGVTGIPFTDTKRLNEVCGIEIDGIRTHEPSSVFVYEVIEKYGGAEIFYADFFVGAVCPLGFVKEKKGGKFLNYNYYDSKELIKAVSHLIEENLNKLIALGVYTDICYCLGTGKNYDFLRRFNDDHKFFERIAALEHPRFIMQYRSKRKNEFVKKYVKLLKNGG